MKLFKNIIGPQVRKLRYDKQWSQARFAVKLQRVGWDITRSEVAKIESRIRLIRDFELGFLTDALGISQEELFPLRRPNESREAYVDRLRKRRY